jgi:periplasmic protein TonB
MFEFAKQNDRPNTMKYFTSLLLSVMVHAAILCVIVTVPLIFSNTLHPEDLLTLLIAPSQPAPISPPAARVSSSLGTKAGGGHAARATAEFTAPKLMPVGIVPAPPSSDLVLDGLRDGLRDGPGNGLGGVGDIIGDDGSSPVAHLLLKEKLPILEPLTPPIDKSVKKVVLIPSNIQGAKLIYKVVPVYPNLARIAHVSGTVTLMALIDEEGNVADLKVLSGHLLLTDAAVQAVKQWKYSPTVLNGEPVPVQATVNVIFTLQ